MGRWRLGIALSLCGFSALAADQDPACQAPGLKERAYTIDRLMEIAHSCRVPEVAELFYNRAQYRRQLEKFTRFERALVHYGDRDNMAYIESYRIFIGMAEAFAEDRLSSLDEAALRQLNLAYERSGEIAEMRFRGYDLIANRLERNLRL